MTVYVVVSLPQLPRDGQNHIFTLCMTAYLVVSLLKIPYMHCIYIYIGLARTTYIYNACTVFLAGKSPNIRSYTVYIYGSGQPYIYVVLANRSLVQSFVLS